MLAKEYISNDLEQQKIRVYRVFRLMCWIFGPLIAISGFLLMLAVLWCMIFTILGYGL